MGDSLQYVFILGCRGYRFMIEVKQLSKKFGGVRAVDGVSFTAANGVISGLLGPNGAGKSTTMRLVAGVLRPDDGVVRIDGIDMHERTVESQERLGVLADSRGLYHRLTSRENIRYYGRLRGLSGELLEKEIDQLIKLLDMQDIADRKTEGFSTGQKVKVAIARILVHRPQNVILDEPTSGLDVMATRAMRDVIRRLRDEGNCVLLSSHIMQEVAALCEHIVILANGRIKIQGSPQELLQKTGEENLEEAFVTALGSKEGLE